MNYIIKMVKLTKVVSDDVYEHINSYVETNKVIVDDYEAMVNLILRMTKDGYCFTMDRDILRDAMESLTFMYCPGDDVNKDRIMAILDPDDSDSDDHESLFVPSPDEISGSLWTDFKRLKRLYLRFLKRKSLELSVKTEKFTIAPKLSNQPTQTSLIMTNKC